ncbi:AAA family ATPase [Candidatus Bathyarchaeota archaeon]|nr:AAA family ATPase [Candidatus Bathyarchaeota archaeon]
MDGPFLIVLSGLPASGKSRLARDLARALSRANSSRVIIIDVDETRVKIYSRKTIHNKFDPTVEREVRKESIREASVHLDHGSFVIHDDMNYFRSMRHELADIAMEAGAPYAIVHVSTPKKTCLKWNEKRGLPIPNAVIKQVSRKFDPPGSRGYQWDAPIKVIDPSRKPISSLIESLVTILLSRVSIFLDHVHLFKKIDHSLADFNLANLFDSKETMRRFERDSNAANGSEGVLQAFDLNAREITSTIAKELGGFTKSQLNIMKSFKNEARQEIKQDPARFHQLLESFRTLLRNFKKSSNYRE